MVWPGIKTTFRDMNELIILLDDFKAGIGQSWRRPSESRDREPRQDPSVQNAAAAWNQDHTRKSRPRHDAFQLEKANADNKLYRELTQFPTGCVPSLKT